ncbi:MAG TPA: N-acetylneuraminate synthase [Phycisphaerales bacterium]|nr:N-acetylneuraminate synthase [Phycisphaerales bacterium]
MQRLLEIDERRIGKDCPIFIIAEAGVNHNGDINIARQLVHQAKKAGADCVKFQTFKSERVATEGAPKANYQLKTTDPQESQLAMLSKMELSRSDHLDLISLCHKERILFLSTPYNVEDVDFLNELGVPAFKLASMHLTEPSFLQYVADKGKPLIISTGMATLDEVEEAVDVIRQTGNDQIVLLQCTTNYPSRLEDANLLAMRTMADKFDVPVGYSDHTQSEIACITSVALGACIIEKHFTLDKMSFGPDHCSSADPVEFEGLVQNIRQAETALGSSEKKPCDIEIQNAIGMKRSIVARHKILKGETICKDMLTFKRPGTGMKPSLVFDLIGKTVLYDIGAGKTLNSWMFEGDPDVEIFELTQKDCAELSEMFTQGSAEYGKFFTPFDSYDQCHLAGIIGEAKRDRYWGMRCGKRLAGFFMLRGFDEGYERPSFGAYVSETFANNGLGKQALQYALNWCRLNKISSVMLKVHPDNKLAIGIYEQAGFEPVEVSSGTDNNIFEKRLTV